MTNHDLRPDDFDAWSWPAMHITVRRRGRTMTTEHGTGDADATVNAVTYQDNDTAREAFDNTVSSFQSHIK